jgi:hypothetical protein
MKSSTTIIRTLLKRGIIFFFFSLFSNLFVTAQPWRPQAPVLKIFDPSYHHRILEWNYSHYPSENVANYVLERSVDDSTSFIELRRFAHNYWAFTDTETPPTCNSTYYYYRLKVIARNGEESDYSNIIIARANLKSVRYFYTTEVLNDFSSFIELHWGVGSYYADYTIERAEYGSDVYTELATIPSVRTPRYQDHDITRGKSYTYRIFQYSDGCESDHTYLHVMYQPTFNHDLVLNLTRISKYGLVKNWHDIPEPYTHWVIERSDLDIDHFKEIGKVMGKQFSFEDPKPFTKGDSYYRVIAMNEDKVVAISEVVSSEDATEEVIQESTVYPNPFKESFKLTAAKAAFIKDLKLLSEKGNEEALEWKQLDEETLEVAVKEILPEGVYYLHIHRTDSKEVEKIRLVKEK